MYYGTSSRRHSSVSVLSLVKTATLETNYRCEERSSRSGRGERYHCKLVWLSSDLLCLAQVLRVCEMIVPTHCALVLFFCFSLGRWPGVGCTGHCALSDSFWHCNCLLWAREWRMFYSFCFLTVEIIDNWWWEVLFVSLTCSETAQSMTFLQCVNSKHRLYFQHSKAHCQYMVSFFILVLYKTHQTIRCIKLHVSHVRSVRVITTPVTPNLVGNT